MVTILGKTINSVVGVSHNDLDGALSSKISKYYVEKLLNVKVKKMMNVGNHEVDKSILEILPQLDKETLFVITDVSPSPKVAELINERVEEGCTILLFDHHKTALFLNKYNWANVVVADEAGRLMCGTNLYFEYLMKHAPVEESSYVQLLAEIVELTRSYDTWDWFNVEPKNIQAKHLNTLYWKKGAIEFHNWIIERLETLSSAGLKFELDELSQYIVDSEDERLERYANKKNKSMQIRSFENYTFGIITVEEFHSELGNILALNNPELDFIAMVDMDAKSDTNIFEKVSLRTIKDIDLSEIAQRFGGGGHSKAAGFMLSHETYDIFSPMGLQRQPV